MVKRNKSMKPLPKGRLKQNQKIIWALKSLLASYVITGILLAVLAVLLYKLELNEKIVSSAITGIYAVSTLAGGLIMGKQMRTRRLFWGLAIGALYFALLLAITFGVYHTLNENGGQLVTTFLLCMGGGALGGMVS